MDKKNITYDVKKDGIDEIIEETKNATMMLREVAWNGRDYHLELRKWIISGEELKPLRGISFSTEDGPNNLVDVMTDLGFGHTDEILENISKREDFPTAVKKVLGKGISEVVDEYDSVELEEVYDPRSIDLDILDGE